MTTLPPPPAPGVAATRRPACPPGRRGGPAADRETPVADAYDLAVVAPAHNEAGNLTPLLAEIRRAFPPARHRVQPVLPLRWI